MLLRAPARSARSAATRAMPEPVDRRGSVLQRHAALLPLSEGTSLQLYKPYPANSHSRPAHPYSQKLCAFHQYFHLPRGEAAKKLGLGVRLLEVYLPGTCLS